MDDKNSSTPGATEATTPRMVCSRRAVSVSAASAFSPLVCASILSVFSAIWASKSRHSAMISAGRSHA